MSDATKRYRDRLHRDTETRVDSHDPERLLAALKLQGVKVVRIQFRTLCFDDRAEMERNLRANPVLGENFICLVREDLEKQGLDLPVTVSESK